MVTKETHGMATSKRRTYDDGCAAAHALDLVGRALGTSGGARAAAGTETLHGSAVRTTGRKLPTSSLERLNGNWSEAGVVRRRESFLHRQPPKVYELTEWGMELEPVIIQLGRCGARSPSKPHDAALGVDSLILSFRTMFDPLAAEGLSATYRLRFGEDHFQAVVDDGRFEVVRGNTEYPDAIIEADSNTMAALVYEGQDLTEALSSGDVKIEGDEEAVERFLTLFPLPELAAPPPGHSAHLAPL